MEMTSARMQRDNFHHRDHGAHREIKNLYLSALCALSGEKVFNE